MSQQSLHKHENSFRLLLSHVISVKSDTGWIHGYKYLALA